MVMRLATLAVLLLTVGCGDDGNGVLDRPCGIPALGPNDGARIPLQISVADSSVTYGNFLSSAANDCPSTGSPTSITVTATQSEPATQSLNFLTFCFPQPELLKSDGQNVIVDFNDESVILLIDSSGQLDECRFRLGTTLPNGTARFSGLCEDGNHPDGFLLQIDGEASGIQSCSDGAGGMEESPVTLEFSGIAEVLPEES